MWQGAAPRGCPFSQCVGFFASPCGPGPPSGPRLGGGIGAAGSAISVACNAALVTVGCQGGEMGRGHGGPSVATTAPIAAGAPFHLSLSRARRWTGAGGPCADRRPTPRRRVVWNRSVPIAAPGSFGSGVQWRGVSDNRRHALSRCLAASPATMQQFSLWPVREASHRHGRPRDKPGDGHDGLAMSSLHNENRWRQ